MDNLAVCTVQYIVNPEITISLLSNATNNLPKKMQIGYTERNN